MYAFIPIKILPQHFLNFYFILELTEKKPFPSLIMQLSMSGIRQPALLHNREFCLIELRQHSEKTDLEEAFFI